MSPMRLLDDETIDALVAGDPVDPRFDSLVPLAEGLRMLGDEPVAPPSPALEALFAASRNGGVRRNGDELAARRRSRSATERIAAMSAAARTAVVVSAAALGVVLASVGGALPDVVANPVRRAVEAVTPFELDDGGARQAPTVSGRPAGEGSVDSPGDQVSDDATGASDGQTGVDGDQVSDEAPGTTAQRGTPDQPGQTGLDRAEETPAGSHLPDEAGSGTGGDGVTPTSATPTTPPPTAPGTTATDVTTSTTTVVPDTTAAE